MYYKALGVWCIDEMRRGVGTLKSTVSHGATVRPVHLGPLAASPPAAARTAGARWAHDRMARRSAPLSAAVNAQNGS